MLFRLILRRVPGTILAVFNFNYHSKCKFHFQETLVPVPIVTVDAAVAEIKIAVTRIVTIPTIREVTVVILGMVVAAIVITIVVVTRTIMGAMGEVTDASIIPRTILVLGIQIIEEIEMAVEAIPMVTVGRILARMAAVQPVVTPFATKTKIMMLIHKFFIYICSFNLYHYIF